MLFNQVLSLVSLVALPLVVNASCNVHFYSASGCSGSSTASCVPDDTSDGRCYWTTWVGSIYFEGCDANENVAFVGCNGSPYTCANAWSIDVPPTFSGCSEIGTYDGFAHTYDPNDTTCSDCPDLAIPIMSVKRVLVIAGSDSSGGAGLEADQRVLAAHGVYALTATTGLTAQNTLGVQDIFIVPAQFVKKQINAGLEDVGADVVKLGMLSSAETIDVIAEALTSHQIPSVVLDPVMVSTSGSQLLPEVAVQSLRTKLLPLTSILTPNVPEAKLLLKDAGLDVQEPKDLSDLIQLAEQVRALGPKAVLLKGGHLPLTAAHKAAQNPEDASTVIDILYDGENATLFETDFLVSKNTHGTGCSLASAIAANLALGKDLTRAVHSAVRFVEAGIKTSVDMGKGSGPINHFHSVYSLPFAPGRFLEYVLARPDVRPIWKKFTEHDFVHGLGSGKLPVERFKQYLVQDYLYLVHFARSNSLAAYKGKSMASIAASAKIVLHIERETALHLNYCASFGLSKAEMESHPESIACTAYSRYILDVGHSEDWLALQMALAPCLIGYGAIAKRLHTEKHTLREGNRYWQWIENYVAEDYTEAVRLGSGKDTIPLREAYVPDKRVLELLETHIRQASPSRMEELIKIFIRATELEISFWDMGLGDHSRAHMTSLKAIKHKSKNTLNIFLQNKWDINEPTSELKPPALGYAIEDEEMTIWLLDHGADPNRQCSIDLTPLSYAVERASLHAIKLLLDRGGDVRKGAIDRQADIVDVLAMLLERGAPLNSKIYESHYFSWRLYYFMGLGTALHKAAELGKIDAVHYLISQGADTSIKDATARTALDCATISGHLGIVKLLQSEKGKMPLLITIC
ncbi:putative thiamine biosynthesis protein (Thi-4) [Aspergillus thermomutatus]|uniref:Uncharacterized protein n=1 Tax=Aspergillus thermomutatus TaxID=41047 RepID=A0A397HS55_ASPTH|nr:uncharacterized protein CDV56_101144 [Aspergillus thermomutatus]RHZ63973.1 hypothetical protein CDV56_101144 [Aspergillus thermomutatus]